MKIRTIAIAFYVLISGVWQAGQPGQSGSFEKQALAVVQRMPVYELDAELPKNAFETWFKELVGPQAGVIWQLSECGEPIMIPGQAEQDIPACAEANAVLPDGSKAIVIITVGTFKKGLTGRPVFFRAVVEHNSQLNLVRRLRDLPVILHDPGSLSPRLPDLATDLLPIKLTSFSPHPPLSFQVPGSSAENNAPPPPNTTPTELQKIRESVLVGNAIAKSMPVYPARARFMNAYGEVQVQVIVSEKGMVIEAKAVSGHPALRSAAVDAARLWVFKPSSLNGAPVKVQSVLTFVFSPKTQ